MRKHAKPILFAALIATVPLLASSTLHAEEPHLEKIDQMIRNGSVDLSEGFLVHLKVSVDISTVNYLNTKEDKGRAIYEAKRRLALESQTDLVDYLEYRGVDFRRFWIINALLVKGDEKLMAEIAARADVKSILPNPKIYNKLPKSERAALNPGGDSRALTWGLIKIGVQDAWDKGITGEGAVIAGQDTGYDWEHPALKDKYRGFDGSTANHDYHWHDAIHEGGSDCPPDSEEPCDDKEHGTHTMGTMVGDDGTEQIGVAPGAKWIGCRNMLEGVGTPARYIECYEFFLAPYPVGGDALNDGDPSYAPDVISNSWGCPDWEGCSVNTLLDISNTVRAAGIMNVTSAGNDGPGCYSVAVPPAIYDSVFSVGATSQSDWNADFSSLGPVDVDGSERLKPDIAAPGVDVTSSVPGGGYENMSGTSMACPHVSGLVALIVSAAPSLAGDPDEIEDIIKNSAVPLTSSIECGDYAAESYPNPIFGHGRIDVGEAIAQIEIEPPDDSDDEQDAGPADGGMEGGNEEGCGCRAAGENQSGSSNLLRAITALF